MANFIGEESEKKRQVDFFIRIKKFSLNEIKNEERKKTKTPRDSGKNKLLTGSVKTWTFNFQDNGEEWEVTWVSVYRKTYCNQADFIYQFISYFFED